jgi:hypothetical protein
MVEYAMPKGIKRVEKGVYRTLDGRHEIRQDGKVWRLVELLGDSQVGLSEFASRGLAVAKLATDGKLPLEAPKPADQPEQPQAAVTESKLGIGGKSGKQPEQPKPRPTGRKPRTKVAAATA